jgi:hypothetical protein
MRSRSRFKLTAAASRPDRGFGPEPTRRWALCHHPPAHAGTIGPVIRVARLLTGVAGRTTLKVKASKGVKMTTSENKKAGVEARSDVARRRSPGRYEEGLARGLAGLAYAVMRKRDNRTAKETAEKDKSGPEPHKK